MNSVQSTFEYTYDVTPPVVRKIRASTDQDDVVDDPDIATSSPSFKLDIKVSEELITSLSPGDLITNSCEVTSISRDQNDTTLYHVVTSVQTDSSTDYCSTVQSIEVPSNTMTDLVGNRNTESSSFEWTYKPCAPSLRYEIGNDLRVYVFSNESIDLEHAALTCDAANASCAVRRAKLFGAVGASVENLEVHNDTCFSFEVESWCVLQFEYCTVTHHQLTLPLFYIACKTHSTTATTILDSPRTRSQVRLEFCTCKSREHTESVSNSYVGRFYCKSTSRRTRIRCEDGSRHRWIWRGHDKGTVFIHST